MMLQGIQIEVGKNKRSEKGGEKRRENGKREGAEVSLVGIDFTMREIISKVCNIRPSSQPR